jgi:hypothetical protein
MKIKTSLFVGTIFYTVGIIVAFFLLCLIVWGDLEASLFSSGLDAEKSLSLRCPVFLSPYETGVISAKFKNPTDNDWKRYTRVFISEGFITLMREIKTTIPIPAGTTETAFWEVYPEDAAYDRIIFFRIYVHAKYPYPSLEGSCGIIMLDYWGLSGKQILISLIVFSITCIFFGILIWRLSFRVSEHDFHKHLNARYALILALYLGIGIGYLGSWVIALLMLTISLLMTGIIIGRKFSPMT